MDFLATKCCLYYTEKKFVAMADSFGVLSIMIAYLHIYRVIGLQPFIWELVG